MDLTYFLLELAVNGALAGLMYALVAMGIVLIYKSSSVPNLAQGALTMLGAYVVLAFANGAGAPMWLAIPLAMVTMFGVGIGIERVALRRLAGRPIVMILMMTLGSRHLPARDLDGDLGRQRPADEDRHQRRRRSSSGRCCSTAPTSSAPSSRWCCSRSSSLFFRTRRGVVLRAIADDYTASWSVGISVERGVALSWAMSSVVATAAGVLWGSVQGGRPVARRCCC